jgi:small subunit ribosomal protein S7
MSKDQVIENKDAEGQEEEAVEEHKIQYVGHGLHPDPKYKSETVAKLINIVMLDGRKYAASKVVYGALDIISEKITDKAPLEVFEEAVDNVKPLVEVRSKRVGGATYQIPVEVRERRQSVLAFRWIKDAFRKKKGRSSSEKLAAEIIDAYNKVGSAMTTRENTHKMAEANKAFAYYA